jgi:phage baseplate assembly protein W
MTTLRGLRFPFQWSATGFPAMREGSAVVNDQMRALVLTGKRERVMRPMVGVAAPEMVFNEISQIQMARLAAETVRSLRERVPLANLEAVDVRQGTLDDDKTTLYVNVTYSVAGEEQSQQIPLATAAQE